MKGQQGLCVCGNLKEVKAELCLACRHRKIRNHALRVSLQRRGVRVSCSTEGCTNDMLPDSASCSECHRLRMAGKRKAGKVKQPKPIVPCLEGMAHHWMIEPPDGPQSEGVCKHCSQTMVFRNSEPPADFSMWEMPQSGQRLSELRSINSMASELIREH